MSHRRTASVSTARLLRASTLTPLLVIAALAPTRSGWADEPRPSVAVGPVTNEFDGATESFDLEAFLAANPIRTEAGPAAVRVALEADESDYFLTGTIQSNIDYRYIDSCGLCGWFSTTIMVLGATAATTGFVLQQLDVEEGDPVLLSGLTSFAAFFFMTAVSRGSEGAHRYEYTQTGEFELWQGGALVDRFTVRRSGERSTRAPIVGLSSSLLTGVWEDVRQRLQQELGAPHELAADGGNAR